MNLKIISWNIWRGKNLKDVTEFLIDQNADIIGLQEVIEDENEQNQAEVIAKELGFNFTYCKAFTTDRHKSRYGIGNAILSRYPIINSQCLMLSGMEDYQGTSLTEPRGAVAVKININGEMFNIYCTHLSFNENYPHSSPIQLKQVKKLLEVLPSEKTILMGDFNSQPESEVVKKLSQILKNTDQNCTLPSWRYVEGKGKFSNYRIDYIFVTSDLNYNSCQVVKSDASDHLPLLSEIIFGSELIRTSYSQKIKDLKGAEGENWLNKLPDLIKEIEENWNIKVKEQLDSYVNFVAQAESIRGEEIILKIYYPDNDEYLPQIKALKLFNGSGMVKLLKVDESKRAVLMEKIKPGYSAGNLEDDMESTRIIAQTMQKIWKKAPKSHVFPTVRDWSKGFKWYFENCRDSDPLTKDLVTTAEEIFNQYLKDSNGEYLLHGDLWHENVLLDVINGWVAIDPKGVVGEREYEVAAMLRNPYEKLLNLEDSKLEELLNKRLDILEEVLGFERERMLKWGFAQTVLSVIWNMQGDRERWSDWIRVAKVLHRLIEVSFPRKRESN